MNSMFIPPLHSWSFFARRLPVHLALLHHGTEHQLDVVRSLLRGMFHNRMESRGLDLWKGDMKRLLKSMETHERDFATRDKLDMLCETVREFMERAFVLDLVVWRTSCTQIEENSSSKRGALDRESVGGGSDIIVRDVIPFLEDDPVEGYIRKIVNAGY